MLSRWVVLAIPLHQLPGDPTVKGMLWRRYCLQQRASFITTYVAQKTGVVPPVFSKKGGKGQSNCSGDGMAR